MTKNILIAFTCVYMCASHVCGQSTTSSGISNKESTVCSSDYSINFVRFGKEPSIFSNETSDRVWLRFTNKSSKSVIINAADDEKTRDFLKGKNDDVSLYYDVVSKPNCNAEEKEIKELPIGYMRREAYYPIEIKPGRSLIFSLARQYLLPGNAAYFTYECCYQNTKESKIKKAYYFSSQLPVGKARVNRSKK